MIVVRSFRPRVFVSAGLLGWIDHSFAIRG
jgi:hypothetical protein